MVDQTYGYIDPLSLEKYETIELLRGSRKAGVMIEAPAIATQRLRYAPEFIDDPDDVGLFKGFATGLYNFRPNFITKAPSARLIGYRTVLTENVFFNDASFGGAAAKFVEKMSSADLFPNEDTRLRRIPDSDNFYLDIAGRNTRHIAGEAVALTSTEPSNFGSFIFRVLPKVATLRNQNLLDLPVIVYANHPSFIDLLEIAGLRRDRIIRHDTNLITEIDNVLCPSLRNPDGFLDSQSILFFQEISARYGAPVVPGRKIYISRLGHATRGGSTRVMSNERELLHRLVGMGVEIFEPEAHSCVEQIKMFSSAEMVIGPSGSGMFNTVFCRPGTKVIDIESERHWIYTHAGLFASCGLRYGLFVGKTNPDDARPVHRSWTLDIESLIARVEAFSR